MSAAYSRLLVHLVWATWDRRPFIDERRSRRVHGRLAAICRNTGCCALAVGGVADHVHLLVSLHPSVAVSALVQRLKVGTSQFVAYELSVPGFAWQEGYGAFSVGDAERDAVHAYVTNQRRHHDEGTTRDDWEQTTVNPPKGGLPLLSQIGVGGAQQEPAAVRTPGRRVEIAPGVVTAAGSLGRFFACPARTPPALGQ